VKATLRLGTLAALVLLLAPAARADLRVPQVPVTGTGLQSLLDAQGQTIQVATEQRTASAFDPLNPGVPFGLTFYPHVISGSSASLNLFGVGDPAHTLHLIVPQGTPTDWFTSVTFLNSPFRMQVSMFDPVGTIQGTNVYLDVPGFGLMFAISGPGGVFYAPDQLNTDGRAHLLFYRGTGSHVSDVWLCAEDQAEGAGGNFDYDDDVYVIEFISAVPVQRSTWGTLKRRFQ
jgi:hypothetical protein